MRRAPGDNGKLWQILQAASSDQDNCAESCHAARGSGSTIGNRCENWARKRRLDVDATAMGIGRVNKRKSRMTITQAVA
eukprot:7761287-Pyramimonas_sp.AAC.1